MFPCCRRKRANQLHESVSKHPHRMKVGELRRGGSSGCTQSVRDKNPRHEAGGERRDDNPFGPFLRAAQKACWLVHVKASKVLYELSIDRALIKSEMRKQKKNIVSLFHSKTKIPNVFYRSVWRPIFVVIDQDSTEDS